MKNHNYLFALAILLLSISQNAVIAQCSIDQFQDSTDAGRSARNLQGYFEGQTFTANASGFLCELSMQMFSAGTGTGLLLVYSGSAPVGVPIHNQQVTVNTLAGGSVWQNWTLNNPPLVTSGQIYTFQFIPDQNGGITDPYGVNVISSNLYSAGNDLTEPTWDLCFKTYVDVATGIDQSTIEKAKDLIVYPNPAYNIVHVSCKNGYQLFALDGRLLKENSMPCNSINIEELQEGLYLLKANYQTVKLMVKR